MAQKKKSKKDSGHGVDLLDKDKSKDRVQKPSKYQVVFHNDDYTPMQFVVIVLVSFFRKDIETAWSITNMIHEKDKGIAGGPYSKEIADTKVEQTNSYARSAGFPLKATAEKI